LLQVEFKVTAKIVVPSVSANRAHASAAKAHAKTQAKR